MHEQKLATDKQKLLACAGRIYLKALIARYSSTLTKGDAFFPRGARISIASFGLQPPNFAVKLPNSLRKRPSATWVLTKIRGSAKIVAKDE